VPSNGSIVYFDTTKLNVLAATASPSQCLLSAASPPGPPTWGSCLGGASVSGVTNSDGTLTISPTTGAVVASVNLGNANTWTAKQTFTNSDIALLGSSTGATTFTSANASGTNYTLTVPAVTSTLAVLGLNQTYTATAAFTGTITVPTQAPGDASTKAASTAFVQQSNGPANSAVWMYPTTAPGVSPVWNVTTPVGTTLCNSAINSTTTMCLQEAINYAVNNGYPLYVFGQGDNSGGHSTQGAYVLATTTIAIPASQFVGIYLHNVDLNCTSALAGNACLQFNSFVLGHFYLQGQITYAGTGAAVLLDPTTGEFEDDVCGISDSDIYLGNLANNGASGTALIEVNLGTCGVNNSTIGAQELNGTTSGTLFGFYVTTPAAAGDSFIGNNITLGHIHLVTTAGVQIGGSTTNQSSLTGNNYKIGSIFPNGASAVGFNTFALREGLISIGVIGDNEGSIVDGIYYNVGAAYNTVIIGATIGVPNPAVFASGSAANRTTINGQDNMQASPFADAPGCGAGGAAYTGSQYVFSDANTGTSGAVINAGGSTHIVIGWCSGAGGWHVMGN
jgi:hypothetical protein